MECRIIIDNRGESEVLHTEHGLSIYFKADGLNWLIDTGASHKFIDNMQILAANNNNHIPTVNQIDKLIISHAHNDHTGGLSCFIEQNLKAEIILSENIKDTEFSSRKPMREVNKIGPDKYIFEKYPQRFTYINNSLTLSKNISVIAVYAENNGKVKYPTPKGNNYLYANEHPDNFNHEIAVLIKEDNGFTIISPCSHNGVLNTIEACNRFIKRTYQTTAFDNNIKAYIGGTHLVDYLQITSVDNINDIALTIKELYPNMKLISGHCTCENACEKLKNLLGQNYFSFHTGSDFKYLR